MSLLNLTMILFSVSLNTFAQLFLKKGADSVLDGRPINMDFFIACIGNFYFWMGFFCYGLSIVTWIFVLSKMPVSLAYPFLSFGFILSIFLANFLFGEPITVYKISGVLLICFGLVILSLGENR